MAFREYLAAFLVASFVGAMLSLLFKTFPPDNKELLVYMVGQLSGWGGAALALYFGASKDDQGKTENTGKALDAITAVANANVTPDAPSGNEGDPVHTKEDTTL